MPLPHLHLYHPPESVAAYLVEWIAKVEEELRSDAAWDSCLFSRVEFDRQASFNLGTAIDRVRRAPGPAIFIQKVQAGLLAKFRKVVQRDVSVYSINPTCYQDILDTCEQARRAYESGEPLIPIRELLAFLIISKLARQDKWGGTALNKSFLWMSELPKGGFPKGICDDRTIYEVADALFNVGLLTGKISESQMKYALGNKALVQPILDSKTFDSLPPDTEFRLQKYFGKSPKQVSTKLLSYKDE